MPNLPHNDFELDTLALHAGYNYCRERTLSVPIYQNTAYNFESLEQAGNRFALKELGNIYSRMTNPTVAVLSHRLTALENADMSVITSSGAAALFYTFVNLAGVGDNIVYANKIYGGTQTMLVHTLKRFGIESKVFDIDDLSTLEKVIDDKTKGIFFESLSNPRISVADTKKIVEISRKHSIISVCDNTVAPFLHRPFDFGVDVIVYSLTKYINGQGNAIGGAVLERKGLKELIKANPRYPAFNTPDPSYHGLIYSDLPYPTFCMRITLEWLRNIGASISPFNAWLLIQGLETLELRIKKHSQNALKVAQFLESHPKIKEVSYPALPSNPYYNLLNEYFKDGLSSGLLSFETDSFETAKKLCNETALFSITVNIGDSRSLIVHPASTTHSQLSEKELEKAGISPCTVRLSVGLENADDLVKDLKKALES